VHQSVVRSLLLDTECWDDDRIDFMVEHGNAKAKALYEAHTPCWYLRPSAEEDSAIVRENWIRAKYERKEFIAESKEPACISAMPEKPKEGFLWKANRSKVWQKRYFVLHGRYLYYFKSPSDSYPKGTIDVCELTFKLPQGPDSNRRYVFEAHATNRVFPLATESPEEMIEWVHTIKRAAAYYITLLALGPQAEELGLRGEKEVLKLSFQQMGTPVKAGFLTKQGGRWQSWNKRLFVITDDALFYFRRERPDPPDLPEGAIALDTCWVGDGDSKTGRQHCISLVTPGRIYFLCASSAIEKQEWMTALQEQCNKLNPQRLVDFSQMDQPAPIRGSSDSKDEDSD